ncbi:MAG: aa3-type cytochrome c oxidase assembly protein subunit CoxG [Rhodobacteraceae bacterium HLUCCA08]|nr:MAG: aa3-type cytochrome c oxidase assembly protein subunit CoxG [Rhodobacteraceae bacterium HLUCCA08]
MSDDRYRALRAAASRSTALQAVFVVVFMGAMAWAAVPFYDWFCRVTGFGGTTGTADASGEVEVLDQTIKVRFNASLARDMPWEFRPVETQMELRIGQQGLAWYEAHNPTDRPITGTASYNVAPYEAGPFFIKVDCFCFEEQVLQPGETMLMPVQFFVDPEIVDDREGQYIHTITLGYTFYESAQSAADQQAALTPDLAAPGAPAAN